MPPYDGIGANEYIVDVDARRLSTSSPRSTRRPIWNSTSGTTRSTAATLARISGETDFPCIYGERVGLGRFVRQTGPRTSRWTYDAWVAGLRDGRSWVATEGLGHLFDFSVGSLGVGEKGAGDRPSVLAAEAGKPLVVQVNAAALLADKPREDIRAKPLADKPYWHIERARIGTTRTKCRSS